jgi:hypothetical protein
VTSNQGGTINFDIERVGAPPPQPKEEEVATAPAGVVDGQDVAQAVFDELTKTAGTQPDKVSCPDLPATVGSSVRCDLVSGADTLGVTVTTSSVEGTKVNFDIAVDGKAS